MALTPRLLRLTRDAWSGTLALPSNNLSFRANPLPAVTAPGQTAKQSQCEQRQTRWLGDGPKLYGFGIQEIVHGDDIDVATVV